jgi:hypothetical protein
MKFNAILGWSDSSSLLNEIVALRTQASVRT